MECQFPKCNAGYNTINQKHMHVHTNASQASKPHHDKHTQRPELVGHVMLSAEKYLHVVLAGKDEDIKFHKVQKRLSARGRLGRIGPISYILPWTSPLPDHSMPTMSSSIAGAPFRSVNASRIGPETTVPGCRACRISLLLRHHSN